MSRGRRTIKDTREEGAERKRMEGIPYERAMGEERERIEARRISRSRDLRCDGVIGYELTGAKGPSRIPLRRGSRRRKLVEGRNRFIMRRGERRRRDFARRTNNSVDTPRPPLLPRCLFLRVQHTRFMLLALLPLAPSPRSPLSRRPFYFIVRSTWTTREVETRRWYLPSYLRQTVPASLCFSLSLSLLFSLHLFCAVSSTQKSRAFAISGSPRCTCSANRGARSTII